jgi:hypothetical protein
MRARVYAAGCGSSPLVKGGQNARILHVHGCLMLSSAHVAMMFCVLV